MQARPVQPQEVHEPRIKLGAGQLFNVYVGAGSTVTSQSGALRLTSPPRWLGEQVFRAEMTLGDGEVHIITDGGWITLRAGPLGGVAHIHQVGTGWALTGWLREVVNLLIKHTRDVRRAET
jgi:hypothetical protein